MHSPSTPSARPSITFETLTFPDGNTLSLENDEIVVFVGPNNAGKSAALRDLQTWVSGSAEQKIVVQATLKKVGSAESLTEWLEKNSLRVGDPGKHSFAGMGYNIHHTHSVAFDHINRSLIAPFFASRVGTDTRLIGSNAAPAVKLYFEPPAHPIHLLLEDEQLATKISDFFAEAFFKDLIVLRAGGSNFPLMVGHKPPLEQGQNELSRDYVSSLMANSELLEAQGDGM